MQSVLFRDVWGSDPAVQPERVEQPAKTTPKPIVQNATFTRPLNYIFTALPPKLDVVTAEIDKTANPLYRDVFLLSNKSDSDKITDTAARQIQQINAKEFQVSTIVLENIRSSWTEAVNAIKDGRNRLNAISNEIISNLERVASTRIFEVPERNILEIIVNSIDASSKTRKSVGKFGMGFYSIFYWLFDVEGTRLNIISTVANCDYIYNLELYVSKGRLMGSIDVRYKSKRDVSGTNICIRRPGTGFSRETINKFKQMTRMLRFMDEVGVALNGQQVNRYIYRQDVTVSVFPAEVSVADKGTGIPLNVVFGELLTPSLSTKGIKQSMITNDVTKAKTEISPITSDTLLYDTRFHVTIVVNGVVIYDGFSQHGSNSIAVIHMPPSTPLPVARDNIIVDERNSNIFKDCIADLLNKAVNHAQCRVFLAVERALQQYYIDARQATIKTIVDNELDIIYKNNGSRIVGSEYIGFYEHITNYKFVAGSRFDGFAVKTKLYEITDPNYILKKIATLRDIIYIEDTKMTQNTRAEFSDGGLFATILVKGPRFPGRQGLVDLLRGAYMKSCPIYLSDESSSRTFDREFAKLWNKINSDISASWHHFSDETPEEIEAEWKANAARNRDVIFDLFSIVRQKDGTTFVGEIKDKNDTGYATSTFVDAIVYEIAKLYGFYRQNHWYELTKLYTSWFVKFVDLSSFSYGTSGTNMVLRPMIMSMKHELNITAKRADYMAAFDIDILIFKHITKGTRITYLSVAAAPHFSSPGIIWTDEIKNEKEAKIIRENHATFTRLIMANALTDETKINLSIFLIMTFATTETINTEFLDWWIKGYGADFNVNVPSNRLTSFYGGFAFDYRHQIQSFVHTLKIKQAAEVLKTTIRRGTGIIDYVDRFQGHTQQIGTFSTNNLIAYVIDQMPDFSVGKRLFSDIAKSPLAPVRDDLQIVGIVVNEGNTRDFTVAVVQELMQNSVDAIRESGIDDKTITVRFFRHRNNLVLSFTDPVGMTPTNLIKAQIPFYSGKSANTTLTGEMGTGFFNVYRMTSRVIIETKNRATNEAFRWISTPVRDESGRVVNIDHTIETIDDQMSFGTTISLFIETDNIQIQEAISRVAVNHIFSCVSRSTVNFEVYGLDGNLRKIDQPKTISRFNPAANASITLYSDKSFQYFGFMCYYIDLNKSSFLTTQGIPFAELEILCRKLEVNDKFVSLTARGFAVDLPKEYYQIIQSREHIRFNSDEIGNDFNDLMRDLSWLYVVRRFSDIIFDSEDEAEDIDNGETPTYYLDMAKQFSVADELGENIDGLSFGGEPGQSLPKGDFDAADIEIRKSNIFFGFTTKYKPFGIGRSIAQIISNVWAQLRIMPDNHDPATRFKVIRQHTRMLPELFQKDIRKIVIIWFQNKNYKTLSKLDAANMKKNEKDKVKITVFDSTSQAFKFVKSLLDVYIEYGIAANILGFNGNMVATLEVVDDPEDTSSYFAPATKTVRINQRTTGSPDSDLFKNLHDCFVKIRTEMYSQKDPPTIATIQDRIQYGPSRGLFRYYRQIFGYGVTLYFGSVIPHEIEHARRHSLKGTSTATNSCLSDHGGWIQPLTLNELVTPKQREFTDCVTDVFAIINATKIKGVSFADALLNKFV